jgi:hypothetical protein
MAGHYLGADDAMTAAVDDLLVVASPAGMAALVVVHWGAVTIYSNWSHIENAYCQRKLNDHRFASPDNV